MQIESNRGRIPQKCESNRGRIPQKSESNREFMQSLACTLTIIRKPHHLVWFFYFILSLREDKMQIESNRGHFIL